MLPCLVVCSLLVAQAAHADERTFVAATGLVTTFANPFGSPMPPTLRLWRAGVSGGYAVERHLVARADLAGVFADGIGVTARPGYELGTGLAYYLQRAYRGPFIEGFVSHASMPGDPGTVWSNPSTWTARLVLGYQATFQDGLSIAFAAGVAETWVHWWDAPQTITVSDHCGDYFDTCASFDTSSLGFAAELRAGYAF